MLQIASRIIYQSLIDYRRLLKRGLALKRDCNDDTARLALYAIQNWLGEPSWRGDISNEQVATICQQVLREAHREMTVGYVTHLASALGYEVDLARRCSRGRWTKQGRFIEDPVWRRND